jgi:hypothetical protein
MVWRTDKAGRQDRPDARPMVERNELFVQSRLLGLLYENSAHLNRASNALTEVYEWA